MTPVRPKKEDNGTGAINMAGKGSSGGEETEEGDMDEEEAGSGEQEGHAMPSEKEEGDREQDDGEKDDNKGEEVKVRRAPNQPSERELQEHMVTHVPFRPWCPYCVAGKSKANPHRRKEAREITIPEVHMDYMFMRTEEVKKGMPILVAKDRGSKWTMASVVPRKGTRLS